MPPTVFEPAILAIEWHSAYALGLIYVRTCRVRNGYRTGHVDVSGTHTPIDAFMLERDRLATGT